MMILTFQLSTLSFLSFSYSHHSEFPVIFLFGSKRTFSRMLYKNIGNQDMESEVYEVESCALNLLLPSLWDHLESHKLNNVSIHVHILVRSMKLHFYCPCDNLFVTRWSICGWVKFSGFYVLSSLF